MTPNGEVRARRSGLVVLVGAIAQILASTGAIEDQNMNKTDYVSLLGAIAQILASTVAIIVVVR